MKKETLFLIITLSVGAVAAAVGIVLMSAFGLYAVGLVVMATGLTIFVPVCPVYQKIGGYDWVFGSKKTVILYIIGIILLAALGIGIALGFSPVDTVKDLHTGGFMLAGLSAALLGVNALICDVIKK